MAKPGAMLTVDADGHVMEPADLWLRYLEPEYRDRALQIKVDADGLESLYVEGKPMRMLHGTLGALGGIEATETAEKQALQTPGARTYAQGCPPGGYDPHARLAAGRRVVPPRRLPARKAAGVRPWRWH